MKRKNAEGVGDYDYAFSPVPAASGFRTMLSSATQLDMFTDDHVDISQAFVQGEVLSGDGHNGKVYISAPPGHEEDPLDVYRLLKPLCEMPSAARAWHTTMSAFFQREGCETVGFEKSMWQVTIDGHHILGYVHAFVYPAKPTNCVLANDDRPYVLPHINLYLSTRHEWPHHFAPL